jgi:tungstate transport system substrate-binding protein
MKQPFVMLVFGTIMIASAVGQERAVLVASTTSTQDSGLFAHLLPIFRHETGIEVRVIAQGTGQALDTGRRGDVDIVFVHAREQEDDFVAEGFGVARFDVMFNDFVLIGPETDPAGVRGSSDIAAAMRDIARSKSQFISRGDRSGTHTAEQALWREADIDIQQIKEPWYREIGQGMGAALNMASASDGYVLADRGTWIAFQNRENLTILVEGDERLRNQYGIILVNPDRHPHVARERGQTFLDWIVGPNGQAAIDGFQIGGEQLFFPNAGAADATEDAILLPKDGSPHPR